MFLSRIPLNPARKGTARFVSSPQVTHAAVLAAFPPGGFDGEQVDGRVLWRMDKSDNAVHLYVVSPREPDFTHVVEQAGWPTTTAWATRDYRPLLTDLRPGQRWHFRLTANPVRHRLDRTAGQETLVRGKAGGCDIEGQLQWLARKAAGCGFEIAECVSGAGKEPDVVITERRTVRFRRGSSTVTLSTATFEGTLTVTDAAELASALTNGVGRAKGYGCGLLTLAPAR